MIKETSSSQVEAEARNYLEDKVYNIAVPRNVKDYPRPISWGAH